MFIKHTNIQNVKQNQRIFRAFFYLLYINPEKYSFTKYQNLQFNNFQEIFSIQIYVSPLFANTYVLTICFLVTEYIITFSYLQNFYFFRKEYVFIYTEFSACCTAASSYRTHYFFPFISFQTIYYFSCEEYNCSYIYRNNCFRNIVFATLS